MQPPGEYEAKRERDRGRSLYEGAVSQSVSEADKLATNKLQLVGVLRSRVEWKARHIRTVYMYLEKWLKHSYKVGMRVYIVWVLQHSGSFRK